MVKTVRLEDGTRYDDLDWNDVQEILNDTQDSTARTAVNGIGLKNAYL
jgi:hypothetical protein